MGNVTYKGRFGWAAISANCELRASASTVLALQSAIEAVLPAADESTSVIWMHWSGLDVCSYEVESDTPDFV